MFGEHSLLHTTFTISELNEIVPNLNIICTARAQENFTSNSSRLYFWRLLCELSDSHLPHATRLFKAYAIQQTFLSFEKSMCFTYIQNRWITYIPCVSPIFKLDIECYRPDSHVHSIIRIFQNKSVIKAVPKQTLSSNKNKTLLKTFSQIFTKKTNKAFRNSKKFVIILLNKMRKTRDFHDKPENFCTLLQL